MAGAAFAQDETSDTLPARPMFARLTPHLRADVRPAATPLTTWNGAFLYQGTTYPYNMVGTAPSTGTSTTVPVFFIPVKMVYKTSTKTTTFDPLDPQALQRPNGIAKHAGFAGF
jgi:hypothetical protein